MKKKDILIEISLAVLMVIMLLSYSMPNVYKLLNVIAYMLGACIFVVEFYVYRPNHKICFFIVGLFVISIFNYSIGGNGSISSPIKVVFQYSPVAFFLCKKKNPSKVLWLSISFFIALLVESAWIMSPDNYTLWEGVSRNYISIFLILSLFLITVIFEKEEEQIPFFVPILFFLLCLLGVGRGGIIAGTLYLGLMLFLNITRYSKPNSKIFKFTVCTILVLFCFVLLYAASDYWLDRFLSRFVSGSVANSNDGRMRIYLTYLTRAFSSFKNFLFGVNSRLISESLNFEIGINLHCSYLQLHSVLGLFGITGFLFLSFRSVYYLKKKKRYQSLCLLIVLMVRILTDYAIFGFITDIIFLYYFYQTFLERTSHERNRL